MSPERLRSGWKAFLPLVELPGTKPRTSLQTKRALPLSSRPTTQNARRCVIAPYLPSGVEKKNSSPKPPGKREKALLLYQGALERAWAVLLMELRFGGCKKWWVTFVPLRASSKLQHRASGRGCVLLGIFIARASTNLFLGEQCFLSQQASWYTFNAQPLLTHEEPFYVYTCIANYAGVYLLPPPPPTLEGIKGQACPHLEAGDQMIDPFPLGSVSSSQWTMPDWTQPTTNTVHPYFRAGCNIYI